MSYAISASSPMSWSRSASTRRLSPPSSWRSATRCAARELALDEIARRLGLQDVELPVEHRAARELARVAPGARRARSSAPTTVVGTTSPPCVMISTASSPVNDAGAS